MLVSNTSPDSLLYDHGYHFVLISKICANCKDLVLENENAIISQKCVYFQGACLFCLRNGLCLGKIFFGQDICGNHLILMQKSRNFTVLKKF